MYHIYILCSSLVDVGLASASARLPQEDFPDDLYNVLLGGIPFMVIGSLLTCMMPGPNAQVGGQQSNFNLSLIHI